jgi:cellulose synthase/poly-beta-1,6-N-acetylglucosamine synthase-like glycosyltransferase
MSVTPLRPILIAPVGLPAARQVAHVRPSLDGLGLDLLRASVIQPHHLMQATARQQGRTIDALLSYRNVDADQLYAVMAQQWSVAVANLADSPPDRRLLHLADHAACLRHGLLPWQVRGGATVIVCAYPQEFHLHRDWLETVFGPVAMALAPPRMIEAALLTTLGPNLAHRAETRVPEAESCRNFSAHSLRAPAAAAAAGLAMALWFWPLLISAALTILALLAMLAFTALKIAAMRATRHPLPIPVNPAVIARLPVVSIMVALYRESDIAVRLVERLGQLDYPRDVLDILLVVEEDDQITRVALAQADLPAWMRVVTVPTGAVKTKPRALNYGLDHCRGSIVGVYDAEDAPEPQQLRKVVDRFHQCGPEVVCLQGMLDFYNPRSNWLARCFTIEYAAWFRLFLPGIERLGLAVPLGGTTLFFRKSALEALGGWDAHNVTEDADLGLRIARHGLRTELIDTITYEEANCRALPWVKQRSRWIKGFMMTWATHMRQPAQLWRQLGPRRFAGFQILFMGSILQALLAPLLWSFWLVPLGLSHPLAEAMPASLFTALWLTFLVTEALTIGFGMVGLSRTRHGMNPLWVPTLSLYHPLATVSAYKGLWELLTRPFYWDKTSHGHFDL